MFSKPIVIERLKCIEAHVRAIQRMVEAGQGCSNISNQISAVRSSLRRIEQHLLKCHINSTISDALPIHECDRAPLIEELCNGK